MTSRPLYVPQFGQTAWGRFTCLQWGQMLRAGSTSFLWVLRLSRRHLEPRRFGFGIAYSFSFLMVFKTSNGPWLVSPGQSHSERFLSAPQCGQIPRQSSRHSTLVGRASATCSRKISATSIPPPPVKKKLRAGPPHSKSPPLPHPPARPKTKNNPPPPKPGDSPFPPRLATTSSPSRGISDARMYKTRTSPQSKRLTIGNPIPRVNRESVSRGPPVVYHTV